MPALVSGYIYLLESVAGDNQNWLHDPENIDTANFTDGVDICNLEIPRTYRKSFTTGVTVTSASGGNEFDRRSARRAYSLLMEGIETSIANANIVEKFIMSDRHTSGSTATFHRYYLVIKISSNNYVEFTDSTDTRREYCTGIVLGGEMSWIKTSSLTAKVKIDFRSVW